MQRIVALTVIGLALGHDHDNTCATTCFKPVSLCRLNAKKPKRKNLRYTTEMDKIMDSVNKNKTIIPIDLMAQNFDYKEFSGCGNCNPRREMARNNGKCPCCEACKRCLNWKGAGNFSNSHEISGFNACCHCVGLCEISSANDGRRRSQRPQSEEIQLFQLSVTQKDRERFAEVTNDAIATDDLLHFDVYRTDKSSKIENANWSGFRRAFFHNCMDFAGCSVNCKAMGAGTGRWIKAKQQSDLGCCECVDPRLKAADSRQYKQSAPMCRNCRPESNL